MRNSLFRREPENLVTFMNMKNAVLASAIKDRKLPKVIQDRKIFLGKEKKREAKSLSFLEKKCNFE